MTKILHISWTIVIVYVCVRTILSTDSTGVEQVSVNVTVMVVLMVALILRISSKYFDRLRTFCFIIYPLAVVTILYNSYTADQTGDRTAILVFGCFMLLVSLAAIIVAMLLQLLLLCTALTALAEGKACGHQTCSSGPDNCVDCTCLITSYTY